MNQAKPNAPAPAPVFDETYLQWKSWGQQGFAALDEATARYFDAEVARLPAPLPERARVLEIGFGQGCFLRYAQQRGWQVSGTEANPGLVAAAAAQGFDVQQAVDLHAHGDNFFDLVVAFDVLEHVPQQSMVDFVRDVKRVLKPGGCFLARFPNGDSPLGMLYQHGDVTHVNFIGSGKVRFVASTLGLSVRTLAGASQPRQPGSFVHVAHGVVARLVRGLGEWFLNLVLTPRQGIAYGSANLLAILQKVPD